MRFPVLISYVTLPGGGTTDYAVEIYYDAIRKGSFTCNVKEGTYMDMMYMPDALNAVVQLMEADPSKLKHRNSFNIASMSFEPEQIAAEIRKHLPDFKMDYQIDPVKQAIANSWPKSMDDTCAREEWGWAPKFDLTSMTNDMLIKVKEKFDKGMIKERYDCRARKAAFIGLLFLIPFDTPSSGPPVHDLQKFIPELRNFKVHRLFFRQNILFL